MFSGMHACYLFFLYQWSAILIHKHIEEEKERLFSFIHDHYCFECECAESFLKPSCPVR